MPHDLFDPALYQGTRRPLLEAETLPAWCYSDPVFYDREMARLFRPAWRLAGRADEIPEAGDYLTAWTAGGSVILLRDREGAVRAFANSCRHRGAELVSGQGRTKALVCPYHSWSYRLDGSLAAAPGMAGVQGFDAACHGLLPLRTAQWGGFLFVTLDDDAPPLAAHLGDMIPRFACYGLEDLRCVRRMTFDVEANWKLLAENALEAYHTGSVHGKSLGQQRAEALQTSGNWTGLLVLDERSVGTLPGRPPPFPAIPGLTGDAARGTHFTMIYPATQLACAQDCAWWFDIQPLGPTRSRLVLGFCFPEATARRADFAAKVAAYYHRWELATPEDNAICEAQQRGLAFTGRPPGRFAPGEFAVHALDNWILDRLLES